VSQEECARLWEGVPCGKVYRYHPKHLCPKLNGKYTSRQNPSIGKTPLVFFNSSTCIPIAKSIHNVHITIFHVWKHKRHFSSSAHLIYRPFKCGCNIPWRKPIACSLWQWCNTTRHSRTNFDNTCQLIATMRWPARRPHFSLAIISVTVQLWTKVFWVISVYFTIRNTLLKSGTFLLGHPVYVGNIISYIHS
jgi:hypothetical protein